MYVIVIIFIILNYNYYHSDEIDLWRIIWWCNCWVINKNCQKFIKTRFNYIKCSWKVCYSSIVIIIFYSSNLPFHFIFFFSLINQYRYLAFEVAIGINGVVWFKSATVKESIVIRNVLLNSQNLNPFQTEAMIELLVQRMKRI